MNNFWKEEANWWRIWYRFNNFLKLDIYPERLEGTIKTFNFLIEKCSGEKYSSLRDFTEAEWLLLAIVCKKYPDSVKYSCNTRYPKLEINNEFFKWIIDVSQNPNLSSKEYLEYTT